MLLKGNDLDFQLERGGKFVYTKFFVMLKEKISWLSSLLRHCKSFTFVNLVLFIIRKEYNSLKAWMVYTSNRKERRHSLTTLFAILTTCNLVYFQLFMCLLYFETLFSNQSKDIKKTWVLYLLINHDISHWVVTNFRP